MAKSTKSNVSQKVTFGTRKPGKAKRKFGPREQKPKKYNGQGR
mgnify:CR=1 FL=1|jgi:hypothetical protein